MASRIASSIPAGVSIPRPQFPKKRKISLRDSQRRQVKGLKRVRFNRSNGRFERRKPLKKIAKARRNDMKHYLAMHGPFLSREENRLCLICVVRQEHGENIPV